MAHAMPLYGGLAGISEDIDKLISDGLVRQVGVVTAVPSGIPVVTVDQLREKLQPPLYKRWWFWVGAAALVGGGFLLFRRRRK